MLLRIDEALHRIINQEAGDAELFNRLVEEVRVSMLQQLDSQQKVYYQNYLERRKTFASEKDELMRFKMESDLHRYEHRVEKVLRDVHSKQQHNELLLESFEFSYAHQQTGRLTSQQQLMVLQAEIDSLKELFNSPGLFRSSKERTEVLSKVEQNSESFRKKLQVMRSKTLQQQRNQSTELTTQGSVETACLELMQYKNLNSLNLTIKYGTFLNQAQRMGNYCELCQQVTPLGFRITLEQFERLMESVLLSHSLTNLQLRFMYGSGYCRDMEFSETKCELIKTKLRRLKQLVVVRLQNYYAEGKLGMFVDFSWQPYRKLIHIFAGKW